MSDEVAVRVDCRCGREVSGAKSRESVRCDCGAVYAVTVTRLREAAPGSR